VEKLVYLVWDRPGRDPDDLRAQVLDDVAPRLLALDPRGLQVNVDDADASVPAMVPVPDDELPVRAQVSVWLDAHDRRAPYEAVLAEVGVRRAGFLVTEALYADYGTNAHGPRRRDWPDGERSPGLLAVTTFDKRPGVDDASFRAHWYGYQSPMSEAMQPRMRYVRNTVVHPVTPGAPPMRAIVEEGWPSVEHYTDLQLFFGATSPDDVAENVRIMLDSMKVFADTASLRTYTMSEYLLRS
jgi:hypothetical protein